MKRSFAMLKTTVIVLAAAALGATIMRLFGSDSWLAFVGWLIFFAALQAPYWLGDKEAYQNCSRWFLRFGKGGSER